MAEARWYWARDGKQGGPISWDELQTMARSGKLRGNDLVWREGSPNWQPANTARNDDGGGTAVGLTSAVPPAATVPTNPFMGRPLPEDEIASPVRPSGSRATRHLIAGTIWLGAGIGLTAISYSAAASSPHGGHYRIFTGAIIVGVIQFVRALSAASGE